MIVNNDPYDNVTEHLDWVVEPPDDIYTEMNAALDSKADLREDCD